MCDMEQRNATSLTPELWAEVFARLKLRLELRREWLSTRDADEDPKHQLNQKEVHQIKLVCKHFKEIHASQPSLVQHLYLCQAFAVSSLPSLLKWLHQSKSSLQIFQSSTTGRLVDIVLAGLVSPESSVRLVDMSDISARSIPMIATFTNLDNCAFNHSRAEHLDLSPLGALPKLNHLVLTGNFKELHHLTGLTRLDCLVSEVTGVKVFATTLQYLFVRRGTFLGVHAQGLSACTALRWLVLLESHLEGINSQLYWDRDMSVVTTTFGLLTQLQTLHLWPSGGADRPAEVEWLSNLISLQHLRIIFVDSRGDVLQYASLVTKLTCLEISGRSYHGKAPVVNAILSGRSCLPCKAWPSGM